MSNIFDALQRSEYESGGNDSIGPATAAELLRRAERRVASRWQTEGRRGQTHAVEITANKASINVLVEPSNANAQDGSTALAVSPADATRDPFSQIPLQKVSPGPQERLVCVTDSDSPAAEAFRLLGVRLCDLQRRRPLKKILITSTVPQEGKSMVAANLAFTLALRLEEKTLLLEGDLRRPSLSKMFGLGALPGICECLRGERALTASIYHVEDSHLWILPAGSAPGNALDLLQRERLPDLMDQMEKWFEWIIIDSPPVLPLADTSVWIGLAEGVLLVTRQGFTEKRQLRRGLEALEPDKVIGAVLNSSTHSAHDDYYYYRSPKALKAGRQSNQ